MSLTKACCQLFNVILKEQVKKSIKCPLRYASQQNVVTQHMIEKHRRSDLNPDREPEEEDIATEAPRDYLQVYPDFLPRPEWSNRDKVLEKVVRRDMYKRRAVMNIPEFYVGSILSVTIGDQYTPDKVNNFVGICTERGGHMLYHWFILRNIVDGSGVEIKYELYNPLIQKIEVLRLEKRLDDNLRYLRDCPPEYSTFPFNMEAVPLPKGMMVPVNPIKVKLNPPPWLERWERMDLKGVENNTRRQNEKQKRRAKLSEKPWEKHDLMLQYRSSINERDQDKIMREIHNENLKKDQKTKRNENTES